MESCLGPNLEALDPLREEFCYHIYAYGDASTHIRVDGYDQGAMIKIAQRIRAKWRELVATMQIRVKSYLVQPPLDRLMRSHISVAEVSKPGSNTHARIPTLSGAKLDESQLSGWNDKQRSFAVKNEIRLREAVEQSLSGLRFLRGHVRMRVNFGTFVLDDYRLPKGPNSLYTFDEFRSMLFHTRTMCHIVPG